MLSCIRASLRIDPKPPFFGKAVNILNDRYTKKNTYDIIEKGRGTHMKKLTFWGQIKLGLVFVLLGFVFGTVTHNGIYCNIGHALYGLLFLLNPVCPSAYEQHPKLKRWIRIAGAVILVVGGFFTRFGV